MVIKDVAVLVDFDKRNTFVSGRSFDHRTKMLDIDIDGACDESRLAGDSERERVDGVVDRSHWSRFCFLAKLRGRAVLAFGQTINAIIEKYVVDVEVAANRMHEMVAAN